MPLGGAPGEDGEEGAGLSMLCYTIMPYNTYNITLRYIILQ